MNIILNKPTENTGVISISMQESDYRPKIDAKLKEFVRKATLPGFRPGKVPAGVIKKMYGKSILVEEVNSLLSESLDNYIKEKEFFIVGTPLPNHDKTETIDWEVQKDFEFEFEIGWVNDFTLDFSPAVSIPQYVIAVDEKMIDEEVMSLRNRHHTLMRPEISEAGDMLTGEIEMEGREKKTIFIPLMALPAEVVKPFVGLKVNDSLTLDVAGLPENTAIRKILLGMTEEEVKEAGGQFTFTLGALARAIPAEMNEEFFTTTLRLPEIKNEEDLRAKLKEKLTVKYENEAGYWLGQCIEDYYIQHTSIALPEEFLRKWIKIEIPMFSDENLEKELPHFMRSTKWGLIERKISMENNIKVTFEEVFERGRHILGHEVGLSSEKTHTKEFAGYVQQYLTGEDNRCKNFETLYQQLMHEKVVAFIKEKITLDKKEVSTDEYKKMVEEHNEHYSG